MKAKRKAEKCEHPEYMVEYFMDLLEERINDAKDEMLERFKWICAQPASAIKFMYENNTMKGYISEEGTISALKHGTFAIGQLGIAETLYILIGEDQTTKKGMELAKKIEQLYMDKCAEFKEEWRVIQINNKELEDDTIRRIEGRLGRKLTNDEKMKAIKYCKDNSRI